MSKTFVVFGATGGQGGSIASYVLNDPQLSKEYSVRAVTRNASSAAAQALAKQGASIAVADLKDADSVAKALAGAHAAFLITLTDYHAPSVYDQEMAEGKIQIDAAVAAGVQHIIFSTLPNTKKISGGKYSHGGFDAKAELEQYIRGLPVKSAFFMPSSFMANYMTMMAPHPSPSGDGTFMLSSIVTSNTQLPLIDVPADAGKWVGAALAEPDKFNGEVLIGAENLYTMDEVAEMMSKATGKTVKYNQLPVDVLRGFMQTKSQADNIVDMLLFIQDFGYYGAGTAEKVANGPNQARGKVTTFEEWLTQNKLPI